jgi:hypothetical protein
LKQFIIKFSVYSIDAEGNRVDRSTLDWRMNADNFVDAERRFFAEWDAGGRREVADPVIIQIGEAS